ncbi:MAG: MFS transporter [Candidatus Bathyarchaeota archaeon]|nr:MFS transporter [Candidatus Bathyarchaeota archaeon]
MWRLGFFFHEIAFGLLSVFIPLYLVAFNDTSVLGGPLVALGIMTSAAIFCSIPASFLWGYLCDTTRHYKAFILLSFLSSAVILFLMTLPFAQNIILFVVLYVVMQVLHVAHEAPKNVLIAEHYSRDEWEKSYGIYEGFTEIGFVVGLVIGLFAFASTLSFGVLANYTLYLCSALSLVAFILSVALVADPLIIFERRLVGIERKIDYTWRGVQASTKLMDGLRWDGSFKKDNFLGFAFAIVLFSLATSIFFTPLPIFLNQGLQLSPSMVYVAYMLSSIGATTGYFLISRQARNMEIRRQMPRFVLFRSLLIFLLVGAIQFAFSPTLVTGVVLVCMGFAYGMYYIMMLSLSMELIPEGKSGLFDGLVGLGAGVGSFLGPFLADNLNYLPTFLIAALTFLFAFLTLKRST